MFPYSDHHLFTKQPFVSDNLNNELLVCYSKIWTYNPYTLARPTVTRPVPDPLAVLSLNNRLFIKWSIIVIGWYSNGGLNTKLFEYQTIISLSFLCFLNLNVSYLDPLCI